MAHTSLRIRAEGDTMNRARVMAIVTLAGALAIGVALSGQQGKPAAPMQVEKVKVGRADRRRRRVSGERRRGHRADEKVTSQPMKYLLNTHHHTDHAGGNETFMKTTEIIAHRNVRGNFRRDKGQVSR
jgi:Metallo-beta-lactamase superfamily